MNKTAESLTSYLLNHQKFIKKHLIIKPKIIIDGICFQLGDIQIQKIWRSFLNYWSETDFAKHLVVLNRNTRYSQNWVVPTD